MQALPVQAGEACVFELAEENSQNEECRCLCSCICDTCLGNTVILSACMVAVCLACGREGLAALRCAALCSAELCLWSTHLMQTTASVMGVRPF